MIALERTHSVGAAPALDFCLEHTNDSFAGDPHAPAPAATAAPTTTAPAVATTSSPLQQTRQSSAAPNDIAITMTASSSIERSTLMQVADTIVSTAAQSAAAPVRVISSSLPSKSSSAASSTRTRSSTLSGADASQSSSPIDPHEEFDRPNPRRSQSAPAGPAATAGILPVAPRVSVSADAEGGTSSPQPLQRFSSAPTTLQRFASAGRAAVAAVRTATGIHEAPPFLCLICCDEYPVELRCALPCDKPQCHDACVDLLLPLLLLLPPPPWRFFSDPRVFQAGVHELRRNEHQSECERRGAEADVPCVLRRLQRGVHKGAFHR